MRFDFYLLHPSIVVNGNRIEFVQFVRNVLVQDPEAMILLEDPNDFPEEWPLAEHYREFVRCVDVYALTNPRCFGKIIGESVFSSARRYLQHGKSVCLMAFPYPELRSLCRVLQSSVHSGQNAAAVFFDEAEEVSTIDLVKCDGKLGFFDIKNVSLEYKPLEDVETLKNRADFPQLEPCTKEDTPSSRIYTYQNGTQKMILKSARVDEFPLPKDHQIKVRKLLRLQEWFTGNGIENALPQKIVMEDGAMRGVAVHWIDGMPFESLCDDTVRKNFLQKNRYWPSSANQLYLLIRLFATAWEYHAAGAYFSDIKGDNFLVTSDGRVIPIDTDGFSYGAHYSSCPRQEMVFSPKEDRRKAFLQNTEIESYSLLVMTYRFLMNMNAPNETPKNKFPLKTIQNDPEGISNSERGKFLVKRWKELPEYLRNALYQGLVENKPLPAEAMLQLLVRYHLELTGSQDAALKQWAEQKPRVCPLRAESARPPKLFASIQLKKADASGNRTGPAFDTPKENTADKKPPNPASQSEASGSPKRKINMPSEGAHSPQRKSHPGREPSRGQKMEKKKSSGGIWLFVAAAVLAVLVFLWMSYQSGQTQMAASPEVQESAAASEELPPDIYGEDLSGLREDISITTDVDAIELSVGQSTTIAVSAAGNLPETWTYRAQFPSDAISTDWGEWMEDGITNPLTVTALKPGNYTITVYFMDHGSDEPQVLAYRTVDVTITT